MSYQVKQYWKVNSRHVEVISRIELVECSASKQEVEVECHCASEQQDELETNPIDSCTNKCDDDYKKTETVIMMVQKREKLVKSHQSSSGPTGKYMVVIQQTCIDSCSRQTKSYKIFSSSSLDKVQESFKATQSILQLLPALPLSQKLLETLFLPRVKTVDELPLVLAKYIHTNKDSITTSEWKGLISIKSIGQYACTISDIELLMLLISNGANPLIQDPQTQNNLLHIAVRHSFKCLKILLKYMEESLAPDVFMTHINKTNLDAVSLLNLNQPQAKRRISKLFSSSSQNFESIPKILDASCQVCKESETAGVTPLMIACQEGNTASVHCLLVVGADPNVCDSLFGTTALHIAATICHADIVKLLLAFNADTKAINSEGKTPLALAALSQKPQAKECMLAMHKVETLRQMQTLEYPVFSIEEESSDTSIDDTKSNNKDDVFLLSFDGGGTKIYTSILILHIIEQKMKLLSKDPSVQITKYFNWFAGTSVGSMVALMMTHGGHGPIDVLKIIAFHKNEIFAGRRIYDPNTLVKFCKKYTNEDDIQNVTEPRVLITTVQADISPPKLVLITNYREDPGNGRVWKTWEAARASSAAPTYFPSFEGKYVDGGILAVNPTLYAMSDIHRYDDRKLKFVLSLGAGESPPQSVDSIDLVLPKLSTNLVANLKSNFKFISGFLNMLTANISNLEGPVNQAQDWCKAIGASYHRFSAPVSKNLDLDTKDDSDIVLLIYDAYIYILERNDELHDIAVTLLKHGPLK